VLLHYGAKKPARAPRLYHKSKRKARGAEKKFMFFCTMARKSLRGLRAYIIKVKEKQGARRKSSCSSTLWREKAYAGSAKSKKLCKKCIA
ncbi:hypothetical protein, partial [Ruminococcus flavefaciens]|uniref:hypothetical protein n=1 Tax=Ruminococcus flavefaciens TaxID=1265 RepID=UPI0026F2A63C